MADTTYTPAVYRKQGGSELVVASGGKITVESGGYTARPVTTRGTSQVATAIPIGSICGITASTTTPTYLLPAPVAGAEVTVTLTAQTSNVGAEVNVNSSATESLTSTGASKVTIVGKDQTVTFHGVSTTRWYVTKNTSIAFG